MRLIPQIALVSAVLWASAGCVARHGGPDPLTSIRPGGGIINVLAIDPATPTTLYAGTASGVFKSTDGGGSWRAVNAGLTALHVRALALDPATPTTLYAGTYGGGVCKSTDGGGSWRAVNTVWR